MYYFFRDTKYIFASYSSNSKQKVVLLDSIFKSAEIHYHTKMSMQQKLEKKCLPRTKITPPCKFK